jgi:DNA-3-methyladenine glycosylase
MRLTREFFERDVLQVAPDMVGKILVRKSIGIHRHLITEVEAYSGIEDQASHARFGRTTRNSIMFARGGLVYVYLIYGMYWMLNVVTGPENHPQAILIRGLQGINGPGKLTKALGIDRTFYGEDLSTSGRIWIENGLEKPDFIQTPRFGIAYAGEPWKSKPWRYIRVQRPEIS